MKKLRKGKTIKQLQKMSDSEIDFSDIPEQNPQDWVNNVIIRDIETKQAITIRLDKDILDFFKQNGIGYQTRINDVLRAFIEAHTNRHN